MVRVKIPAEIKIGAYEYRLSLDANLREDEERDGTICFRKEEITVAGKAPMMRKNTALIHEVLHLADKNYEMQLNESQICQLSHAVAEFLFNNLGIDLDWSDIPESQ